jgi:YD repeat-containing protein
MVAIVAGSGLGLFNTSMDIASAVWGQGVLGQAGGRFYVNAATGNLVMQVQDEQLSGRGLDLRQLRTYNSLGAWSDGDRDGWRWDGERRLTLSGKLNTVGSTLTRTGGDGHDAVYTWDAGSARYVGKEGSGAHDTIVYDTGSRDFVWTDGSSRLEERYAGSSKLLKNQTDASGNRISYTYDANGLLRTVSDDSSRQRLELTYASVGGALKLQRVDTYALVADASGRATNTLGAALKQVAYTYDSAGRLKTVSTDLTPQNTSDNAAYVTTYTYDGTSTRVASVTQSDGTSASFTYDSQGRVLTVTDAEGTQTFTYVSVGQTDITDANGKAWTYLYDDQKRLTEVRSPAPTAGAARQVTQFRYDADGNLKQVTDARGNSLVYEYDVQGNRTLERDPLGNSIERTYDARNQVVTETRYQLLSDGAKRDSQTTRYVYDTQSRLRYVVSAEGRVGESRYGTASNGYGLLTRSLQYVAGRYDVSGLSGSDALSEDQLNAWVAAQDKSLVQQTQYDYDLRGNLSKRTDFATSNALGNGVLDAAASVSEFIYSGHGELLQTIVVRGVGRNQRTTLRSTVYDGMGRELQTVDAGGTRTTVYDDANRRITVTNGAGLVIARSFDARGRLESVTQSAAGISRATQYVYDAAGRLRMVQDAQGVRRYSFYDAVGRLQYEVDGTGAVVGYAYNAIGQLVTQVSYQGAVADTSGWYDAASKSVTKAALTVGAAGSDVVVDDAHDRITSYDYDDAGRLVKQTDAANLVIETTYDGVSRVSVTKAGDRVTRYFYDRDGRQVGMLDALGFLTENKFDGAGRLVETIRFKDRSPQAGNVGAPVWVGVNNRTVTGGRAFEYRLPAPTDPDGDGLSLSVVGTLPSWLHFDATSLTLGGTPPLALTSYDVTLRASDGQGKTSDVTVRITVGNSAPSWGELPDQRVAANAAFNLILPAATDVESRSLTYSIVNADTLPPGLSFDASQPALSGAPSVPGSYAVTVRVSDGQLSTDKTFILEVTNNGPSWAAVPAVQAWAGVAHSFIVPAAIDPEGQSLSYRVISKPDWLSFNETTRNLSGMPPMRLESSAIVLEARDASGETVRLSFSVNVGSRPPTWAALTDPAAKLAGYAYDYAPPAAVDPEGQALTYSAVSGLPQGLSVNASTGRITGTTNQVGAFTVVLRATDPLGQWVERSVTLRLNNAPPVYNRGIVDRNVQAYRNGVGANVTIVIPADAFVDPNGDNLSGLGAWGMPSWLTFDPTTRTFSGHTANVSSSSVITVVVSDARGANAYRSFVLTVTAEEPPPPGGGLPMLQVSGGKPEAAAPTMQVAAPAPVATMAVAAQDILADWRPGNSEGRHSFLYYDGQGRLVGSVDERGFLTETVYDAELNRQSTITYLDPVSAAASDTLSALKDRAGTRKQSTVLEYDALGRLSKRTDVDGTVSSNEYDGAGRLVREVRAEGSSEQRGNRTRYNAFGDITGVVGGVGDAALADTDAAVAGYGMRYEYDSLGRQIKAIDANDHATWFYYDRENRLTHTVDARGGVSETVYNAFGQVQTTRRYAGVLDLDVPGHEVIGGTASDEFLAMLAAIADSVRDQVTVYEYDQRGQMIQQTDGEGFVTTNTYSLHGQLATQTRTIGAGKTVTTQFGYDLRGQLRARTDDVGGINQTGQWEYDAYGRVVRSVDGAGKAIRTNYKDSGRTIETVDALDRTMRSEYDAFERVLKQVDARGQSTTYSYDDVARTVKVTTPEGITVTTTRNRHGQTLSVLDARGNTTDYSYDKDGRLKSVTDALRRVVAQNDYDNSGRLIETRDARGISTVLSYDALNRVVLRTVDPTTTTPAHSGLNLQTHYEFDQLGQQVRVTEGLDGPGQRITQYEYDRNGRLTQVVVDPDGLKLSTRYSLDGFGNSVRVERGTLASPRQHVVVYEFDALGRRVKEIVAPTDAFGAGSVRERDLTTEYRYDAAGRLSRVIDAQGQSTWYIYDAAGQRTHTINAEGEVSQSWYDANGRLTQSRQYLNRLDASLLAGLGDVVADVLVTADAADRRSYAVYDNDGRQRYSLQVADAQGHWLIAESRYDDNGNLTEARRYDKYLAQARLDEIDSTTSPGITDEEIAVELRSLGYDDSEATLADVQRTRFAYDADNRLRFTVDALGSVSANVYDDAGQVVARVRYAVRPALTSYTESAIQAAVNEADAANQVGRYAYDAAGRLRYSVQLQASNQHLVSKYEYDALGRLVSSTAYATVVGAVSDYAATTLDAAVSVNAQDRRAAYAYDAAGRQVLSAQLLGDNQYVITQQQYDALGQVVRVTAFATIAGSLAAPSASTQDRTTSFVYDAAGRQRFVVAADGALTETVYDALGRATERRLFDLRVDAQTARTLQTLSERRAARQVGDGVTRGEAYTYDRTGRVLSTTDAKGYVAVNQYNALGERKQFTDKNGNTWTFAYDRLGRLRSQVAPAVLVVPPGATTAVSRTLETKTDYNVFGNIESVTERYQSTDTQWEERVTSYLYDRLGRLTQTTAPGWYDPATGSVHKAEAIGRFQRMTETSYDTLGQAVRIRVRIGAGASDFLNEYKTYDVLGRVVHDVDALNNVTAVSYNRFGEQATVTRYSTSVSGAPENGSHWTAAELAAQLDSDSDARTITTSYDQLGRKTEVRQSTLNTSNFYSGNTPAVNAGSVTPVSSAAARTLYEYNAFGELHHERQQLDASRWRDTWHYHDVMGRETRTVDALGYQTARSYDALGNLSETVEYANAGAAGRSGEYTPPGEPTQSSDDRITAFVYDARNQQITVLRKGLRYFGVSNARDVAATVQSTTYDGLGKVLTQTDGLGSTTTSEYDERGQLRKVTEPARQVAADGVVDPFRNQVSRSPVTVLERDGFGNVVRRERDAGTGGADSTRTWLQEFDHAGNVVGTTDANGNVHNRKYDYAGRLIRETQDVSTTLGDWKTHGYTLERRYAYDSLGRQTHALDIYLANGIAQQSGQRNVFNAFGEIEQELRVWGRADAALASLDSAKVAFYTYDKAGQMLDRTAADGQTRYYYDLAGNVTRQEQRARGDTTSAVRVTETYYDLLGRASLQRQPTFNAIRSALSDTAEAVTTYSSQLYDRWGNVLFQGRGGYVLNSNGQHVTTDLTLTEYSYNADNKIIREWLPTVTAVNADGSSYQARVSHQIDYDLLGRAVRERDLADNAATSIDEALLLRERSREYNAAGQLTAQTDATGIRSEYAYDGHGNLVGTRNALGTVYVDRFDHNGNLTSHGVLRQSGGAAAYDSRNTAHTAVFRELNRYQYDQANRRVASADVMDANGATVYSSYTQLDERGLVVATRNPSGIQVSCAYDELGNRTSETDANGNVRSWHYVVTNGADYTLGQLDKITVGSNRQTTYTYNGFGQLESEQYNYQSGQRSYQYHANGLLKSRVDTAERGASGMVGGVDYLRTEDTTSYEYTVRGERAKESFSGERWYDEPVYEYAPGEPGTPSRYDLVDIRQTHSLTTRASRMSYDALGRLQKVDAPAAQNPNRAAIDDLTYAYDELGNRRRILAHYRLDAASATQTSDLWSTYDAEGRMTLVNAERLGDGQLHGTEITYDALGRRATALTRLGPVQTFDADRNLTISWVQSRQERYSYNDQNLLTKVEQRLLLREGRSTTGVVQSDETSEYFTTQDRSYDSRGNLARTFVYSDVSVSRSGVFQAPVLNTTTQSFYRDDGRIIKYDSFDAQDDRKTSNIDHYDYDDAGNLKSYEYKQGGGGDSVDRFTNTYSYDYTTEFGGYQETQVTVATTRPGANTGYTRSYYDGRGQLIVQSVQDGNSTVSSTFTYDGEGRILAKGQQTVTGSTPGASKMQDYLYANGNEIANIGTLAPSTFSNGYTPFSAAYPSSTPGSYVVGAGDTLGSIARVVFGDAQLWYLIADANSLAIGRDDALPASELGKSYRIPNLVSNVHNNAGTFQPYNPASIIGNTLPTPGLPPLASQCAQQVGQVLAAAVVVAITVAVTAYTGGALAGTNPILAGALTGAIGSFASQSAAVGLGIQDDFNGKQILTSTFNGAFSGAGLNAAPGFASNKQGGAVLNTLSSYVADTVTGQKPALNDALLSLATKLSVEIPLGQALSGGVDKDELLDKLTNSQVSGVERTKLQDDLINSQAPKWTDAVASFMGNGANPQNGWIFSDRQRNWSNIASQALNAFTSTAVNKLNQEEEQSGLQLSRFRDGLRDAIAAERSGHRGSLTSSGSEFGGWEQVAWAAADLDLKNILPEASEQEWEAVDPGDEYFDISELTANPYSNIPDEQLLAWWGRYRAWETQMVAGHMKGEGYERWPGVIELGELRKELPSGLPDAVFAAEAGLRKQEEALEWEAKVRHAELVAQAGGYAVDAVLDGRHEAGFWEQLPPVQFLANVHDAGVAISGGDNYLGQLGISLRVDLTSNAYETGSVKFSAQGRALIGERVVANASIINPAAAAGVALYAGLNVAAHGARDGLSSSEWKGLAAGAVFGGALLGAHVTAGHLAGRPRLFATTGNDLTPVAGDINSRGHYLLPASGEIGNIALDSIEVRPLGSTGTVDGAGLGLRLNDSGPTRLVALDPVELAAQRRLNALDGDVGKYRPGEAGAAAELENYLGGRLGRAPAGTSADFIVESGPFAGARMDLKLTPDTFAAADKLNTYFDKTFPKFSESFATKLARSDGVDLMPFDTRFLTPANSQKLFDFVDSLPLSSQRKIIYLGE